MNLVRKKFAEFKVRVVRQDDENPDRKIIDFEDCLVNMEHVLNLSHGPTEDTSILAFPNGAKLLAKGGYQDLCATLLEESRETTTPEVVTEAE